MEEIYCYEKKIDESRHSLPHDDKHCVLFSTYPEVMSVDQVAEALGVRPNYVREMLMRNILRGRKVGYKWRVLRSDLREFMLDSQS